MNISPESILSALFTLLQSAVKISYTGNGSIGSPVITGVSTTAGMFQGLPAFGPGVQRGASILSFDPVGLTVTLDQNLTVASTGGAFTTGFLTIGRRAKLWTDVAAQPAMFLQHIGDQDDYVQTVLQRTTIEARVLIYSRAGENPDFPPDAQLNNLVTAVRGALATNASGYPQTLGGLVQWARVEGRSQYDPGDLDNFAKAMIPIRILCP